MKKPPPPKFPDWLMTRNQWMEMYQNHPMALAEELLAVFKPLENDNDVAVHNFIAHKITKLCRNEPLMLRNVARAIIATASHSGDPTDGKDQ
jgi:hypothetical protein